jgi:hypothetical protein
VVYQEPRELQAGELAPLIGIEDLGWVIAAHGALNRIETEIGRQRVGQPPRQHSTTRPVKERLPLITLSEFLEPPLNFSCERLVGQIVCQGDQA